MGVNQMAGTPWHTEKMTRAEGDPRRHLARCIYYIKTTKKCDYYHLEMPCPGAAQCDHYQEKEAFLTIQKEEKKSVDLREFLSPKMVVNHSRYGCGQVITVSMKEALIRFNDGEEKKFQGKNAIKSLKNIEE